MLDYWNTSYRRRLMESTWESHLQYAWNPCFFSKPHVFIQFFIPQQLVILSINHSINQVYDPRETVGYTLRIYLVSRILLATYIHVYIYSFSTGSLTKALITNDGEYDRDTRLLVSRILRYFVAIRIWPFFLFCGICYRSDPKLGLGFALRLGSAHI